MSYMDIAVETASAAGRILRAYADRAFEVKKKGDINLVTEVDLACEAEARRVLARLSPDIPVLGEEGCGESLLPTQWVIDPLDGTTNFVHGFPIYCVSIGLRVKGRPMAGAIYDPIRNRMYRAERGQGAFCNDRAIQVSRETDLGSSLIATGFAYDHRSRIDFHMEHLKAVMLNCRGVRRAGAAALDLAFVAEGCADGFWEFNLRPWDVTAGFVLVEEAGGRVSALPGASIDGDWPSPIATNGLIHEALECVFLDLRA